MTEPNKQPFKNPVRRFAQGVVNVHRRLLTIKAFDWHLAFWCSLSAALVVMLVSLAFLSAREFGVVALVNGVLFAGLAIAVVTARWNRSWLLFIAATIVLVPVLVVQHFDVVYFLGAALFSPVVGALSLTVRRRWLRMLVATVALAPLFLIDFILLSGNDVLSDESESWVIMGVITLAWMTPLFFAYYVPEGAFPTPTKAQTKYPKVMWGLAVLMSASVLVAALYKPPSTMYLGTVARALFTYSYVADGGDRCFAMANPDYTVCNHWDRGHPSIVLRHQERELWNSRTALATDSFSVLTSGHGAPQIIDVINNRAYIVATVLRGDSDKMIALDVHPAGERTLVSATDLGSHPIGERCVPVAANGPFLCVREQSYREPFEVRLRPQLSMERARSEPLLVSRLRSMPRARLTQRPSGTWLHIETVGQELLHMDTVGQTANLVESLPVTVSSTGLRHRRGFWAARLSALQTEGLVWVGLTLVLLALLISRLLGSLRLKNRINKMFAGTLSQTTFVGLDGVALGITLRPGFKLPNSGSADAQPVVIEVSNHSHHAMPFRANDTVAVRSVHLGDKKTVSAALQTKHNQRTLVLSAITFVLTLAALASVLFGGPSFL